MSVPLRCVVNRSMAAGKAQLISYGEAKMLDTVLLTRRGAPVFNYATLLTDDGGTTIYNGKAECSVVSGGNPVIVGDETEYWDTMTVNLPDAAPEARIDDMIEVVVTADPDVVGRKFRVTAVESGGLMPAGQKLTCLGVAASRTNPGA